MIDERGVTEWRRKRRRPGLVELAACRILRELAAAVPPDEAIVELGAYRGRSTGWLLLGAQDGNGARVTSVDVWESAETDYPSTRADFLEWVRRIGANPTRLRTVQATAVEAAQQWTGPPVGLLWHDAEHDTDSVQRDLTAWLPHLAACTVVVLHDACNPEMGVVEGARAALGATWAWPGRLIPWVKHPSRRGLLVLRRLP